MVRNNNNVRVRQNLHRLKGRIFSRARKNKDIIFGGQSIKKQIGLLARRTKDIDAFTKEPERSAREVEKHSDKVTRGDNFYVKKGINPGTWKVKGIGKDRIRGNADDFTLVDYTKMPRPRPKTVIINGIPYRKLQIELEKKNKILRDKAFAFRRAKDLEDRNRILRAGRSVRKGGAF